MDNERRNLTNKQRFDVCNFLDEALIKEKDGKHVRYASPGMNDKAVADKFGITVWQVQNLRSSVFGRLAGGSSVNLVGGRLKRMERRIEAIMERLGMTDEDVDFGEE